MSKKAKRIIGVIIIIILVIGVIWLLNEYARPEPTSLEPVNELPNEDMEENKTIANIVKDEPNNIVYEPEKIEPQEPTTTEKKENNSSSVSKSESEVISGTSANREEQAVELAKEYYEHEYGSTEGVYFNYNDIYKDGRYIITVGNANGGANIFLYVNLSTGEVSSER